MRHSCRATSELEARLSDVFDGEKAMGAFSRKVERSRGASCSYSVCGISHEASNITHRDREYAVVGVRRDVRVFQILQDA